MVTAVVNNVLNSKDNLGVPVTTAEFVVMKTACSVWLLQTHTPFYPYNWKFGTQNTEYAMFAAFVNLFFVVCTASHYGLGSVDKQDAKRYRRANIYDWWPSFGFRVGQMKQCVPSSLSVMDILSHILPTLNDTWAC